MMWLVAIAFLVVGCMNIEGPPVGPSESATSRTSEEGTTLGRIGLSVDPKSGAVSQISPDLGDKGGRLRLLPVIVNDHIEQVAATCPNCGPGCDIEDEATLSKDVEALLMLNSDSPVLDDLAIVNLTTSAQSVTSASLDSTGPLNPSQTLIATVEVDLANCDEFNVFFDLQGEEVPPEPTVSTVAGTGVAGFNDGASASAQFNEPRGIAVLSSLNVLLVADRNNNRIRLIDLLGNVTASPGSVTTRAGSGIPGFLDNFGTLAQFFNPTGVAVDSEFNVYVADASNSRIREIDTIPIVTTLAGTGIPGFLDDIGALAQFFSPTGVAVDSEFNVYVADSLNHRIRKIDTIPIVTTLAGTGVAGFNDGASTSAQFNGPIGVAVDSEFNVYVADLINQRIRKIDPFGNVTTLAGTGVAGFNDGASTSAQFNNPTGVAVDSEFNVYVADASNHRIRKIDPFGNVTTLAGTGTPGFLDGLGNIARFNFPIGVAVDSTGNVYVADFSNHRIRLITP